MKTDEALRKAEALGSVLARRLLAKKPRTRSFWYRTWQITTAYEVSNLVGISWFRLSGYQFREGDDYSVVMEGRPVTVEIKGSLTERNPPWPVSKGMGSMRASRR